MGDHRQRSVWHGEIRNRAKDGHFYWVDTTIVPFLNDRGKPYQYIAIRADITARKAAEQRLAQQAALARVGQMAAVVAHEVKNPLAGIKGAIQVLMSRRPPGDPETSVMRDIVARIDSLDDLIQDLMMYARPRPPRLSPVNLRHVIDEAVTMLRRDPVGSRLQIHIEGDAGEVTVDPDLIRATVLNLLLNAAHAMNGNGDVQVLTAARQWKLDNRGPRQRPWHSARYSRSGARTVFHHESAGRWPWTTDCQTGRRTPRRNAHAHLSRRRRHSGERRGAGGKPLAANGNPNFSIRYRT